MTDLELMVVGAIVTMLGFAGAYIGIRHRANEEPVDSYARQPPSGDPQSRPASSTGSQARESVPPLADR